MLVGPDNLCLDLVSFTRSDTTDAYMWLKGLLERCRLKTGATLELKTPAEASPLEPGRNYVILGDARVNALANCLDAPPIARTPHAAVYRSPADPDSRVLQILGANVQQILANAQALPLTIRRGRKASSGDTELPPG